MPDQISVLFVCLGNICRSTMSEGVFQSIARKEPYKGLISKVDSCGTGEALPLPPYNLYVGLNLEKRATTSAKSQITGPWPLYGRRASRTTSTWRGR
jgi:protein-tyrosine-phosphatase